MIKVRGLVTAVVGVSVLGLQPLSAPAAAGPGMPPELTVLPGQCTAGGAAGSFVLDLTDADTTLADLSVRTRSSNTRFLRDRDVRVTGDDGRRTLTLEPRAGAKGSSQVQVVVSDGSGETVELVTVRSNGDRSGRVKGTNGADLLVGAGGNDRLVGRGGPAVLCGGPGRDVLRGGGDADHFDGGPGKDRNRGYRPEQGDTTAGTPRVTTRAGETIFTELGGPVAVDSGLLVTDPTRRTRLTSALVRIAEPDSEHDVLAVVEDFGITGSYQAEKGLLSLTGKASARRYRTVLRSVTFDSSDTAPPAGHEITFQVEESGGERSNVASRSLQLVDVPNEPSGPVLDSTTVAENSPAGTVVGRLSAQDADDAAGDLTFSLAPGGADNDAFTVDGTTLRTAAVFDHETRSSYAVRLRVEDPAGNRTEADATITVTDVNDAPSELSLSPASIDEGRPAGSVVGTLTATDQDAPADSQTFTLVAGAGDGDNASFAIAGDRLTTAAVFSHAARPSYTVRVQADDGRGGTFARSLVITVRDTNAAPADVSLSGTTVNENEATGSLVGTLTASDPDPGDTHTFALTAGAGDADNARFAVDADRLETAGALDHEAAATRSVRIRATDGGGQSFGKQFTITVQDVNEAPTLVELDSDTVAENQPSGTAVGTLSSDDPESADTHTYTLVSGAGSTDNARFQIVGDSLQTAGGLDFETDPTASVRIRSTDAGGLVREEQLTITVTDVNEAPVADDETFTGVKSAIGNTALVVDDATDGPAIDPAGPQKTVSGDLLDGDTDPDAGAVLRITPGTYATDDGGSVDLQADGDFVFHPAAGTSCTDGSDFFDYTVSDGALTDTGRVEITITDCVWFVDNDAAGNAGTSAAPFDTLTQAAAASDVGHTLFVYDGDDSTTGLDAGITLKDGQRLIGQAADLQVAGVDLETGSGLARPTLTAAAGDVVTLASGNEVRGLRLDPQGGGGVSGALGVAGGTFADLVVDDLGSDGTGPGVELISTTGTFTFSDLSITTSGAAGLSLDTAGTAVFTPTGTIGVTTQGAQALHVSGTAFGGSSELDLVTATGATSGGLWLSDTTGAVTFGEVDLTTSSGATAALRLRNAAGVTVAGADSVLDATGGPAIDVDDASGASLTFASVSSQNSSTDGISLTDLGTGTFAATAGTVSGFAGDGFAVNGGSGTVTFGGAIQDGPGRSAYVTRRTGGAVTLGAITDGTDAAGGILLALNTGGSTVLAGAVALQTGSGDALAMTSSDGHSLLATGGLALTATSGRGVTASSSGTVSVTGTGNTITTTTGRALDLSATDIAPAGLTFQSISSDGADHGIQMSATGGAGGLVVTGAGPAASGGTIQRSTGDGIELIDVGGGVDLTDVRLTANGDAVGEHGLDLTDVTGAVNLTDVEVTGSAEDNLRLENSAGNLTLSVLRSDFGTNSASSGGEGIALIGTGTGTMTATIDDSDFTDNRGDHVQLTTDSGTTVVQDLTVTDSRFTTTSGSVLGGGVTINPGGNAVADVVLTGNTITGAQDSAIVIDTPGNEFSPQPVQIDATISGNVIGTAGSADSGSRTGDGITVNSQGGATVRTLIENNTVRQYNFAGIGLLMNDGNADLDATVRSNVISAPGAFALDGISFRSGSPGGAETSTTCLDLGGPSAKNSLNGSGGFSGADIYLTRRAHTSVRLPGYVGAVGDNAAVAAYLQGRNDASGIPTTDVGSAGGGQFLGGPACVLPTP